MFQWFRLSQQQSGEHSNDHAPEEAAAAAAAVAARPSNNHHQGTSRGGYSPIMDNPDNYSDLIIDDEEEDDEYHHDNQEEQRQRQRQPSRRQQQNTNTNLLDAIMARTPPTEGTRLINPRRPMAGYNGNANNDHDDQHSNDNDDGGGSSESLHNDPQLHPENGRNDENQPLQQQQQQQSPGNQNNHNHNHNHHNQENIQDEDEIGIQIANLTNRLRVLFYTLYIPIIPLSVLLFALLIQLLIKAASSPPCSYPLRFFALASFLLFLYAPNHKTIKRVLFNYSRERDGMIRPRAVRIYDQFFHMICLMYIYLDMVLVQSCREDIVNNASTCSTTCPDLYSWFQRFDIVLRIFVGVLVLPLVCLPFVYIWIMRRIHTTEALWRLHEGLEDGGRGDGRRVGGEDSMGGVKVKDIMENLKRVRLVPCDEDRSKVRVVGEVKHGNGVVDQRKDWDTVKDCCICMCEFECKKDEENERDEGEEGRSTRVKDGESSLVQDEIVQTRCGHLFHRACIGAWIGGRNWEDSSSLLGSNVRARRRCCP
eukprot:CAMPEP_0176488498 /NCGR_PEP_ID=MMETSP0200_2-20121128/6743_1 /TAXON_ID=947934 /ORGANISM="Chaetoceros sp., Strain GSL56" /LENGTH=536 /DNA_ID=CAMNT_0017885489 /DNA_START=229 /DNA_END=1836 /DNA_ORIENTATION=-